MLLTRSTNSAPTQQGNERVVEAHDRHTTFSVRNTQFLGIFGVLTPYHTNDPSLPDCIIVELFFFRHGHAVDSQFCRVPVAQGGHQCVLS